MAENKSFELHLGRCLSAAPGIPITDMARTVEYYELLGFTFRPPDASSKAGVAFAIARRDGIELHFALKPDHDPGRAATWVYVRVEDVDELMEEFRAAGAEPSLPVHDTAYGMREFAQVDPDGNLILFGSRLRDEPGLASAVRTEQDEAATSPRRLADSDAVAFWLTRFIKLGDVDRLTQLLDQEPGLAGSRINSLTPLHLFADAPGHRPNAAGIVNALVGAGADPNAHARGTWHHETPLHWAASNDDVALIDALLDSGADVEHPGSSIDGGPAVQSALGYGQWAALRRLWERGASIGLSHAAALGLTELVTSLIETDPPPKVEETSVAFWSACRAGQIGTGKYLLAHGADLNWSAPWDGKTPLDAALAEGRVEVATWLHELGARKARTD